MEYIGDIEKTKQIANELAKNAQPGDCFCLLGDLGAGKTEFSRAFIQALCGDVKVTSPTYNIVQQYEIGDWRLEIGKKKISNLQSPISISHFDLYRIKHEDELEEIGFTEALEQNICLIEWPQVAKDFLPAEAKKIELIIIDENTRKIICS